MGNKTQKFSIVKSLFLCILRQVTAQCGAVLQVASNAELGTLTKCHCGIFKELPNIKGEVVVAGGVLEEEDLPVVSFRPKREDWDRWSTPLMFLSFSSVHVALKQGTLYTDQELFTGRPVI